MVRSKALSSIVLTAVSVMVGGGHVVYAADGADSLHTAAARPEPSPISADARNMALAKEWLERFRTASIDRSQLDPRMSSLLTDDFARGGSHFVQPYGKVLAMYPYERRETADAIATFYHVTFAKQALTWIVSIGRSGKIDGLTLRRKPHDVIYQAVLRGQD